MTRRQPLLYFEVHGEPGPYLLLVHGFLSSRAHWILNLEALSANFCPVVIELLGHARSPAPDDTSAYSPNSYVAEFEVIRHFLGIDRWFVCGQSLGAALTLRYSLEHPESVIAQVFTNSNSALAGGDWAKRVMPIMEAQAQQLERDGRAALDKHPFAPTRSRRLPRAAKEALIADYALHNPIGIARTAVHTIPYSSVRDLIAARRYRLSWWQAIERKASANKDGSRSAPSPASRLLTSKRVTPSTSKTRLASTLR